MRNLLLLVRFTGAKAASAMLQPLCHDSWHGPSSGPVYSAPDLFSEDLQMPLLPEQFPGEKLAIKIWETVTEKGIGGLLSPWQIKHEGRATAEVRRQELLLEEQARQELEGVRAGRKRLDRRGRLVEVQRTAAMDDENALETAAIPVPPADARELLALALQDGAVREAQRMLTLRRIAAYAEEEAEGTPDDSVSDETVNPDWFARWRRNAEDATDELLRRLWARVLAGEVRQPKSFSFRTLDFLRNISVEEANLIQRLGPIILNGEFFYRDPKLLDSLDLSFPVLMELQDLGVIAGVESLGMSMTLHNSAKDRSSFLIGIRCYSKLLWITSDDPNKKVELPRVAITRVGKEILGLGEFSANIEYLTTVGGLIKNMKCKVSLGDCEVISSGLRLWNAVEL
jgi:hypothetical protein